jgi:Rap1-interacting factor 1 N terminal
VSESEFLFEAKVLTYFFYSNFQIRKFVVIEKFENMAKGSEETANNKTSAAAQKVYDSTKEVFVNKQKSLYKKTLTILKRFTLECSFENIDESLHAQFLEIWFKRILPLLFDGADPEVRDAAIDVVAAFVPQLKFTKYQEVPSWSSTKAKIVDKYSKEIENLRTTANENWAKIWCLTMQILDVEIVRSAVLINQFLNIVEKGFRSGDLKIRAESFVCWRILVQIFAKHNELDNPKRIRLICIPLKSSKSKTAQIAENKFYVWWYLIAQFHKNVDTVVATVVEPFLYFCFGPVGKPPLQGYINEVADEMLAPAKA